MRENVEGYASEGRVIRRDLTVVKAACDEKYTLAPSNEPSFPVEMNL